jgi:hypothetical protein
MKQLYYTKFGASGNGLTNQLITLALGIMKCQLETKSVLVVDDFFDDVSLPMYSPVSAILDMDRMNIFLEREFGVTIIDIHALKFTLQRVLYGTATHTHDLTDRIQELFCGPNSLHVPHETNLNLLKGDPCPHRQKIVTVQYEINGKPITEQYAERNTRIESDIIFNGSKANCIYSFKCIDAINRRLFDRILQGTRFHPTFVARAEQYIAALPPGRISCVHLRIEDDAITHWSKMNAMSESDFREVLETKYMDAITRHIPKTDHIVFLTYSYTNRVIDHARSQGYSCSTTPKDAQIGREKHAIVDVLISAACTGVFIGNFNPVRLRGSTFSYFCMKLQRNPVHQVLLDLDSIQSDFIIQAE